MQQLKQKAVLTLFDTIAAGVRRVRSTLDRHGEFAHRSSGGTAWVGADSQLLQQSSSASQQKCNASLFYNPQCSAVPHQ
jgi:hypothetical protein